MYLEIVNSLGFELLKQTREWCRISCKLVILNLIGIHFTTFPHDPQYVHKDVFLLVSSP